MMKAVVSLDAIRCLTMRADLQRLRVAANRVKAGDPEKFSLDATDGVALVEFRNGSVNSRYVKLDLIEKWMAVSGHKADAEIQLVDGAVELRACNQKGMLFNSSSSVRLYDANPINADQFQNDLYFCPKVVLVCEPGHLGGAQPFRDGNSDADVSSELHGLKKELAKARKHENASKALATAVKKAREVRGKIERSANAYRDAKDALGIPGAVADEIIFVKKFCEVWRYGRAVEMACKAGDGIHGMWSERARGIFFAPDFKKLGQLSGIPVDPTLADIAAMPKRFNRKVEQSRYALMKRCVDAANDRIESMLKPCGRGAYGKVYVSDTNRHGKFQPYASSDIYRGIGFSLSHHRKIMRGWPAEKLALLSEWRLRLDVYREAKEKLAAVRRQNGVQE